MLIVLCGIPGSGKTTFSKELADQYSAVLYSYDNLPGANTVASETVREKMWDDIAKDLVSCRNVVCDDLNILKKWRAGILSSTSKCDCKKFLIVFSVPLKECIRRNNIRKHSLPPSFIERMYEKFDPPTTEEGWDEIVYVNPPKPN